MTVKTFSYRDYCHTSSKIYWLQSSWSWHCCQSTRNPSTQCLCASVWPLLKLVPLVPGQVTLWPIYLLAVYVPPHIANEDPVRIVVSSIPSGSQDDRLLNYGLRVIQLGVMLMQLNDTESEGDGDRSLINWKMLMLYFRCRHRGMKYAYEAMRFITCQSFMFWEDCSQNSSWTVCKPKGSRREQLCKRPENGALHPRQLTINGNAREQKPQGSAKVMFISWSKGILYAIWQGIHHSTRLDSAHTCMHNWGCKINNRHYTAVQAILSINQEDNCIPSHTFQRVHLTSWMLPFSSAG